MTPSVDLQWFLMGTYTWEKRLHAKDHKENPKLHSSIQKSLIITKQAISYLYPPPVFKLALASLLS